MSCGRPVQAAHPSAYDPNRPENSIRNVLGYGSLDLRTKPMRRREFITLVGGTAVAWPLAARAQQPAAKLPRIGIIDDMPIWNHFRQALHDLGYIEGHTIAFEYRTAQGVPERL